MATPGNLLKFMNWSPAEIAKCTEEALSKARKAFDYVGNLKPGEINFENIVKSIAENGRDLSIQENMLDFPQHVSTDKSLREASTLSSKRFSEFIVEMQMRKDVFERLVDLDELTNKDGSKADWSKEACRFLQRLILDGRRNGLHLEEGIRDEIKKIQTRLSELSIDFSRNLNEENTVLEFTKDELAGAPADFVESLDEGSDGKLKVSLKYPHYFPCMKYVRVPDTRKRLEKAFNTRCIKENTPILEELVELRHKKSQLLGYPTHSSFILELRMAKSPEKVATFLSDLAERLKPVLDKERARLLNLKKADCEAHGYDFDGTLNPWDIRYYMTMVEEKDYAVDQQKLKEYFPIETVTKGMLDIYQELLGLKFEEVPDAEKWHEDVTAYRCSDAESGTLLGYFYMDLFPREGKYGHAACFPLQGSCVNATGERQLAVAAVVANFTKPTKDAPSLLLHDEVDTYFHEFGHCMHNMCALAEFNRFSGTHVERDFVEAPSQMLENWCWEKESLRRMSSHYKDGSDIPDELLDTLIKSRKANVGFFNMRQILLGTFDQTIHTREKADTAAVLAELQEKLLGVSATPGTNMSASFGHLGGGYDAQYYGYMWSEVFSADMFASRFKKEGLMSPDVGMDYRRCILQPGGSIDAEQMLQNFLGREPRQDAFLELKGLQ